MTVIKVENLYKEYRLGVIGSGTLYRDLQSWWARLCGKEDPNSLITYDISKGKSEIKDNILALREVSFEVNQGDIVGVIGRNGAGKSTLLKILSKITSPTKGEVKIKGRIASLLEVGTGFHPELTGRENIYLNGTILGMKKKEIDKKIDEIIEFAEIEKFIDTPVKRYSSGMYVRLAFAVAAHLESEILLVDEVLAVGDAQFQKKSLGKMEDVAKEGRTILFVSHNMGSILNLCNKAILFKQGALYDYGFTREIVNIYLNCGGSQNTGLFIRENFNPAKDLIESVEILNKDFKIQTNFQYGEPLNIRIKTNSELKETFGVTLRIKNSNQEFICCGLSFLQNNHIKEAKALYLPGEIILVKFPSLKFVEDTYYIDFICNIWNVNHIDNWWDAVSFKVTNCKPPGCCIQLQNITKLGSFILDDLQFLKG